jgi:hypothetical protein
MVIHVATVHHRDPRFIDLQLAALTRWMGEPFETWAVTDGVPGDRFDHVVTATSTKHGPRLDAITAAITQTADPSDVILFLDGDAWPVADPTPTIREVTDRGEILAVRRDESPAGPWPHPLFCAVTVTTWAALDASWAPETWHDPAVALRYDVGAGVGRRLIETHRVFTPLLRMNAHNPHPLFFGVYGRHGQALVYHHGAGFRPKFSHASRPSDTVEAIQALSDEILACAVADPAFWCELV